MDKNEYNTRLEEIGSSVDQGNYAEAARVADTIDWRRVRNVRTLCLVSEIYEAEDRFEDSKEMLLKAYKKSPSGRAILYRLVEVCIHLRQFDEAVEYYSQYVHAAPNDPNRLILKYRIYRGRGSSVDEQIEILKEYLKEEYNEKYAYELAKLYQEADRISECLTTCDDLVLWFHSGKYVIRALELKKRYAPLTPKQQEIYDHRFDMEEEEDIGAEKQMVETEDTSLAETIMEDTTREIASEVARAADPGREDAAAEGSSSGGEAGEKEDGEGNDDHRAFAQDEDFAGTRVTENVESDSLEGVFRAPVGAAAGAPVGEPAAQAAAEPYAQEEASGVSSDPEDSSFAQEGFASGEQEGLPLGADMAQQSEETWQAGDGVSSADDTDILAEGDGTAAGAAAIPNGPVTVKENKYNTKDFQDEMLRSMRAVVSGVGLRDLVDEDEAAMDALIDQSKQEQAERIESDAAKIRMTRKLTLPELQKKADAGQLSIDDVLLSMGERGTAVRETVEDARSAAGVRPQRSGVLSAVDEALLNMGVRSSVPAAQEEPEGGEVPAAEENAAAEETAAAAGIAAAEESAAAEIMAAEDAQAVPDVSAAEAAAATVEEAVSPEETAAVQEMQQAETLPEYDMALGAGETPAAGETAGMQERVTSQEVPMAQEYRAAEETAESEEAATPQEKPASREEYSLEEEAAARTVLAAGIVAAAAEEEAAAAAIAAAAAEEEAKAAAAAAAEEEARAAAAAAAFEEEVKAAAAAEAERKAREAAAAEADRKARAAAAAVLEEEAKAAAAADAEAAQEIEDDVRIATVPHASADVDRQIHEAYEQVREGASPEQSGQDSETVPSGGVPENMTMKEVMTAATRVVPTQEIAKRHGQTPLKVDEPGTEDKPAPGSAGAEGTDGAPEKQPGADGVQAQGSAQSDGRGQGRGGAAPERMWLKKELRGFFDGYLSIRDMDRQIAGAIEQIMAKGDDKTSRTGNVLIFGGHGCGKTTIGTGIAKAIAQERGSGYVKMAKIYAADLNRKDIAATIARIAGGVLIVEEAGDLDDMVADQLTTALEFRTDGLVLILEDEQRYIHDLLMRHPRLTMKFTSQIYIPAFTARDLAGFAALYADDRDYAISDEAAALLQDRLLGMIENSDNGVSITNVLDITDEAIARANKFSRKLFSGKKRFDDEGRVVLQEKDFR